MTDDELERAGIAAAQAGRLDEAQRLLAQAVKRRPESAAAGWWLSQSLADPARQEFCVRRALALDPEHAEARRWLAAQALAAAIATAAARTPDPAATSPAQPPPAAQEKDLTVEIGAPPAAAAAPPPAPDPAQPPSVLPANDLTGVFVAPQAARPAARTASPTPAPAARRTTPVQWLLVGVVGVLGLLCLGGLVFVGLSEFGLGGLFNVPAPALLVPAPAATDAGQGPTAVAQQPTRLFFPTLPPEWTVTPSPLPPTVTPTPTVGPTDTPTPASYQARLASVQSGVAEAKQSLLAGQPAQAVAAWDSVLKIVPEYTEGYFGRAQAYLELTNGEHYLGSYLDYLRAALADLNQAIALDPTVGAYYLNRYYVLDDLGHSELYRVDQIALFRLALSDIRQANQLGNSDPLAPRDPAFELFAIGDCQAGLDEINKLIAADPKPSAGLNTGLADGYACLGQFGKALAAIDKARAISPSFDRDNERATILYNVGSLAESRAWLDKSIAASPNYCGCRYYLRALIEYQQGQRAQAAADIDTGSGNTWVRGGLRSYVLGHLALDAGHKAEGIALLQEAEASMPPEHGPLRARTLKELAALGAAPLAPPVSVSPTPTLLPLTPQSPGATPAATLTPLPQGT